MTVLLVVAGGAVGAALRYLVTLALPPRSDTAVPWGTLTVNVAGSLLLGATAGAVAASNGPDWVLTLVGTGFCGALTTFSAFGLELVERIQRRAVARALLYCLGSLTAGLLAYVGAWELLAPT